MVNKMNDVNYSAKMLNDELINRSHIRNALVLLRKKFQISGMSILELGSGLGFNLKIFSKDNSVLGYEGLSDAAALAVIDGIPTEVVNLENEFPCEDSTYDVVLALDVLEHLVSPENSISESYRALRQKGILIVYVPNHFSLIGRVRILLGSTVDTFKFFPNHELWNYPHLRFFNHASIIKMIELAGFKLEIDMSEINFQPKFLFKIFGRKFTMIMVKHFPNLFAGGYFIVFKKY